MAADTSITAQISPDRWGPSSETLEDTLADLANSVKHVYPYSFIHIRTLGELYFTLNVLEVLYITVYNSWVAQW